MPTELRNYKNIILRMQERWGAFREKRAQRMAQHQRQEGGAAEKVAENILEDFFTSVLDWKLSDVNLQMERADIVLTDRGTRKLVVEVKRPGSLKWNQNAVATALGQAVRYASEQKINRVAVSDGSMLYAADLTEGGLMDRCFVDLDAPAPDCSAFWLCVDGLWRPPEFEGATRRSLLPGGTTADDVSEATASEGLLHPKYKLPAHCFAYVGDPNDVKTWKLPHLLLDGSIDTRRLPLAIRSLLRNYRGQRVGEIAEAAIPDVLTRLGRAAYRTGRMPEQCDRANDSYKALEEALAQHERLDAARCEPD